MAETIELKVSKRDVLGKKVRFLRNEGIVPMNLFGHNVDSLALQADASLVQKTVAQAGRTRLINLTVGSSKKARKVLVREVQRDAVKGHLIHVDLYEVKMTEKIRVDVPVILTGESPAMRMKENMLSQELARLSIECFPDKMPNQIEVDISTIKEADDAIRVKDILLKDYEIMNDSDLVIVKVSGRPAEEMEPEAEVETSEAEGSEPESKAETKTEDKKEK